MTRLPVIQGFFFSQSRFDLSLLTTRGYLVKKVAFDDAHTAKPIPDLDVDFVPSVRIRRQQNRLIYQINQTSLKRPAIVSHCLLKVVLASERFVHGPSESAHHAPANHAGRETAKQAGETVLVQYGHSGETNVRILVWTQLHVRLDHIRRLCEDARRETRHHTAHKTVR